MHTEHESKDGAERCGYDLRNLSDGVLVDRLTILVDRSNRCTAVMLAHIAEVDRRRLYRASAVPSMFDYCVRRLGLSEAAAYKRLTAARAARRFPVIFEMVAGGRLHLSGIKRLASHLTDANHAELLEAAANKSCREIEKLLAERAPQPDASSSMRRLPRRTAPPPPVDRRELPAKEQAPAPATESSARSHAEPAPTTAAPAREPVPSPKPPTTRSNTVTPTAAARYRVQFTADQALHDKIERAQDLLRHVNPRGDLAEVVGRALDVLIAQLEKRKYGKTDSPRAPGKRAESAAGANNNRRSRHIPNAVRREVAERDGGRCTYVDAQGRRCPATGMLELHHVTPWARGGSHTTDGVTLRCKAHNLHAAELDFGRGHMERATARRSASTARAP